MKAVSFHWLNCRVKGYTSLIRKSLTQLFFTIKPRSAVCPFVRFPRRLPFAAENFQSLTGDEPLLSQKPKMTDCFNKLSDMRSDPAADAISDIIAGAVRYKILVQCVELGIFDDIEALGEACPADVIAKKNGYEPSILERLLNTLCSFKLMVQEKGKKGSILYRNAPGTSRYLVRSKRPSMIGMAMTPEQMILPLLDNLQHLLKSGKGKLDINKSFSDNKCPISEKENNADSIPLTKVEITNKANLINSSKFSQTQSTGKMDFSKKAGQPNVDISQISKLDFSQISKPNGIPKMEIGQLSKMTGTPKMPMMPKNMNGSNTIKSPSDFQAKFLMAMEGFSATCAPTLAKAFDLSHHKTAVDLGGGPGRISFELSKQYPHLDVVVFDLPPVVQMASKMQPPSTMDQVKFKPGNFFEDDLPSGDLYILGHILHGWDDSHIDVLLQKVYCRLPPGGTVLVMEKLLNETRDGPESAVTNDFILTLLTKGKERTESEYRALFTKHGFINIHSRRLEGYNHYDVMSMNKPL